ncbi:hypothetical protein H4P12_06620 [Paracoccus sp. 11-3]|uniref:Peptidase inhibitor I78 family protein n=1 Tax=Paracoccus amoyensis TaxID=2760093 RepID=A0A926GC47_9RHOB|nr:hypothetical protein [Paracoccus amoyensis]MBC9246390.1 hypothetical protein [Paracoccus amoyensis]
MRPVLFLLPPGLRLLPLVLLTACTQAAAPASSDVDIRSQQQAACTATVATHLNKSIVDITARWLSEADGIANVEAIDGDRRHLCNVDATGRVVSYSHPRE